MGRFQCGSKLPSRKPRSISNSSTHTLKRLNPSLLLLLKKKTKKMNDHYMRYIFKDNRCRSYDCQLGNSGSLPQEHCNALTQVLYLHFFNLFDNRWWGGLVVNEHYDQFIAVDVLQFTKYLLWDDFHLNKLNKEERNRLFNLDFCKILSFLDFFHQKNAQVLVLRSGCLWLKLFFDLAVELD